MEKKVLVSYATTHGSTGEIAQEIASALARDGLPVEILPAAKVRSLSAYCGVILGAPQYMFHLHKDALRFLSRFKREWAAGIPVAVFAGGSIENGSAEENETILERLNQELENIDGLNPVSVHIVGGKFNPDHLHFPYNLIPALKNMPAVDYRDWPAILAWVLSLKPVFLPQTEEVRE